MRLIKIRTVLILVFVAIALAGISWWVGQQAYSWLPPQASSAAILIDDLFSFLVTVGTFIFLGVAGTLTVAALLGQTDKDDLTDGPAIAGNVTLEVVWTAIPFVLVIWIATYSYQIYGQMAIIAPTKNVHLELTSAEAVPIDDESESTELPEHIEVVSRQWAWEFRYPKHNVTSTELHLPNHQRVKLTLESEDVLHGLYVPAFRLKQDIIPNLAIDFELTPIREGKYRLRDSQYSGTYFAAMQTDVVVESLESYQQWLAQAAAQSPVAAYNPAFEEYRRLIEKGVQIGWKPWVPAAPPIVNYSGSSNPTRN